jgi:hypothetical protein
MLTRQKGKNQYQGVYGALHRRLGVRSSTMIRQEQYDAVPAFLEDWYDAAKEGRERKERARNCLRQCAGRVVGRCKQAMRWRGGVSDEYRD